MDDEEFLRRLQALTHGAAVWDGFDPSSWRSIELAEEEAIAEVDRASDSQGGCGWDSDDSAGMIFSYRHLTEEERAQSYVSKHNRAREYASDEPLYVQDPEKLEKVNWKETGLAMGELSQEGEVFVSWDLVEGYPDMYVGKRNSVRAAPLFTLDALHENRVWDLYYVHQPVKLGQKPAIFVPTYQFQHLLDVINAKLETQLTIPPGKNEERFKMSFGHGNTPRPRFLGRSNSPECFKTLCAAVPAPKPEDALDHATHCGREEFMNLLAIVDQAKKRTKDKRSKPDKNRIKRIQRHRDWSRSVKRVQRYLGLRQKLTSRETPLPDKPAVLGVHLPITQEPEGSVLFVAIDIEAYEENQALITEVGIAMLDTNDIRGVAPGDGGQDWFQLISARHIRVKENSWAINSRYIQGCANHFSFGTSEFIEQAEIPAVLEKLIDNATLADPVDGTLRPRPVVLVFHESSADINYLKKLGYSLSKARNVVEIVDTREMHQSVGRSNDGRSLGSVLDYLGIPSRDLHNAGNDAVYTLRAMIGLAVKKRLMSLEKTDDKLLEHHIPYSEFKEKEKQHEEWASGGEDTDGGDAITPVSPEPEFDPGNEKTGSQDWW
ncbi:Good for full DBP5 activity protein 2 [Madurella fahalii]|uniref:Good for full DBP5 activity protein 2 n=1 Tax=Madurella fahalii TaxID=1157608 RepID=A0ABQ0GS99_9PEZI